MAYQDTMMPAIAQLTQYFQGKNKDDEERAKRYKASELVAAASTAFAQTKSPQELASVQAAFASKVNADSTASYLGISPKDINQELQPMFQSLGQGFNDQREDARRDEENKRALMDGTVDSVGRVYQTFERNVKTGLQTPKFTMGYRITKNGVQFTDGGADIPQTEAIRRGADPEKVIAAERAKAQEARSASDNQHIQQTQMFDNQTDQPIIVGYNSRTGTYSLPGQGAISRKVSSSSRTPKLFRALPKNKGARYPSL